MVTGLLLVWRQVVLEGGFAGLPKSSGSPNQAASIQTSLCHCCFIRAAASRELCPDQPSGNLGIALRICCVVRMCRFNICDEIW